MECPPLKHVTMDELASIWAELGLQLRAHRLECLNHWCDGRHDTFEINIVAETVIVKTTRSASAPRPSVPKKRRAKINTEESGSDEPFDLATELEKIIESSHDEESFMPAGLEELLQASRKVVMIKWF